MTIILFVDLAGFTALTDTHGDVKASEVVREFEAIVRKHVREHGLHEVKTIGDAFLLTCESAPRAVTAVLEIVSDVNQRDEYPDVRVGIHAGDVVEREGDIIGQNVNIAARVAALAGAGEVLVTSEVIDRGLPPEVVPVPVGTRQLRHIASPVELFDVAPVPSGKVKDPVCHMRLAKSRAAGSFSWAGRPYHFCSRDCLLRFLEDPDSFVG